MSSYGKPTVKPNPESGWILGTNFFTIILSLVTLILVALLLARNFVDEKAAPVVGPDFSAAAGGGSSTLIGSTACDDGNSCTQDFRYTIENTVVCRNEMLPTNTSCSHQCLITDSGLCVNGKCKGLCSGYCPYYIDFDPSVCPSVTLQPDIQTAVDASSLFFGPLCFYGKCVYVLESPITPAFTCALADSLSASLDFVEDTPQCLSFLDHTDIVSGCFKASTLCVTGFPVCIYQYTCSGYDIFSPTAPPVFGSQSLHSAKAIEAHQEDMEEAEVSGKHLSESADDDDKKPENKTKTKPKSPVIRGKTQKFIKSETLSVPPKKAGHKAATYGTRLSNAEIVKIRKVYLDSVHKKKPLDGSLKRTGGDTVALGELTVEEAKLLVFESLGGDTLGEFIAANILAAIEARNETL